MQLDSSRRVAYGTCDLGRWLELSQSLHSNLSNDQDCGEPRLARSFAVRVQAAISPGRCLKRTTRSGLCEPGRVQLAIAERVVAVICDVASGDEPSRGRARIK